MAIPYIVLNPQKRQQLRLVSSVLQLVLSICFFIIFTSEFFMYLISVKYGIRTLLASKLVTLINKNIILMVFSVPLFVLHVYQIQLLLKQTERRCQLSFKQLTEFMMASATALAFVLLMFMFSLSYAGRFRKALTETLAHHLLLSNSTARDTIHNDFYCCGVFSYRDYLPENEKDMDDSTLRYQSGMPPYFCLPSMRPGSYCVAPASCCLQPQCSTLIRYYNEGPDHFDGWYRKTGCLESISRSFKSQLSSTPMTIFLFIVFLLEIASVISLQFTLSSFTLLKEANADLACGSFGWLLPIGYPSPTELIAEIRTPRQNQEQMVVDEEVAEATIAKNDQENEEPKKSMMTDLIQSLNSKVSQVS